MIRRFLARRRLRREMEYAQTHWTLAFASQNHKRAAILAQVIADLNEELETI